MMVKDDGTVRYFTLREAARLVGLPDNYAFPQSWTESMRQLGNAVPAQLGAAVGGWLVGRLDVAEATTTPARQRAPRPETSAGRKRAKAA
jgi:DNA (cytosine-5)-methyltransferase 1